MTIIDSNMPRTFFDGKINVVVGDITEQETDAIVNAANWTLLGGGGVDGAIHDKGGRAIWNECKKIRDEDYPDGLPTGLAVITTGGNLKAKYVIHTVGPIYGMNDGKDAELLAACYANSIKLAIANGLQSISFPSISTGAFGYPKHSAAAVVGTLLKKMLAEDGQTLPAIYLVFFSESDAKMFIKHSTF